MSESINSIEVSISHVAATCWPEICRQAETRGVSVVYTDDNEELREIMAAYGQGVFAFQFYLQNQYFPAMPDPVSTDVRPLPE